MVVERLGQNGDVDPFKCAVLRVLQDADVVKSVREGSGKQELPLLRKTVGERMNGYDQQRIMQRVTGSQSFCAAMRRRVRAAWSLHFLSERRSFIAHGLLMKSQSGRSCSKTCGRATSELRGIFQERMFPAATPSTHSAVIISAL